MLVLRRKEGQWVEITHAASGDVIRVKVYNIRPSFPGQLDMAFDDDAHDFSIERPERFGAAAAAVAIGDTRES